MTDPAKIERITRSLAYMLRHQPEKFDLDLDPYGYADVDETLRALNERLGEPVSDEDLATAVRSGDRPRYEIQGEKIRALYGHSIQVEAGAPSKPPEFLYVALPSADVDRARRFGLKGGRRRYLHLALTEEEACDAGRRAAEEYTVLRIRALDAWEEGAEFFDRQALWLAESVPTHFLEVGESYDDGTPPLHGPRHGERGEGRGPRRGRFGRDDGGRRERRGPRDEPFREPPQAETGDERDEPSPRDFDEDSLPASEPEGTERPAQPERVHHGGEPGRGPSEGGRGERGERGGRGRRGGRSRRGGRDERSDQRPPERRESWERPPRGGPDHRSDAGERGDYRPRSDAGSQGGAGGRGEHEGGGGRDRFRREAEPRREPAARRETLPPSREERDDFGAGVKEEAKPRTAAPRPAPRTEEHRPQAPPPSRPEKSSDGPAFGAGL